MIIKKINELIVSNNDIYVLNTHTDYILINDNYQGLIILNEVLDFMEKIFIFEDIHIYHLYSEYNGNGILVYSLENEQFILVDVNSKKQIAIKISINDIFSSNYYWNDKTLLMVTFNDEFYQLCFSSYMLKQISTKDAEKICSSFYNFWNASKNSSVLKFYSQQQAFIARDDATKNINFFSCSSQKYIHMTNVDDGWHDIECSNNVFMFIYEKKIELLNYKTKVVVKPHAEYIFLRAKFLGNNKIVVLSSKSSNAQDCRLETYFV